MPRYQITATKLVTYSTIVKSDKELSYEQLKEIAEAHDFECEGPDTTDWDEYRFDDLDAQLEVG